MIDNELMENGLPLLFDSMLLKNIELKKGKMQSMLFNFPDDDDKKVIKDLIKMGYSIIAFREMDEHYEPITDEDQANNIHDWLEQTDSDVECPFMNPECEFGMYPHEDSSEAEKAVCKKYCHLENHTECPSLEQVRKNAIAWLAEYEASNKER
jgi:hypothetical protein